MTKSIFPSFEESAYSRPLSTAGSAIPLPNGGFSMDVIEASYYQYFKGGNSALNKHADPASLEYLPSSVMCRMLTSLTESSFQLAVWMKFHSLLVMINYDIERFLLLDEAEHIAYPLIAETIMFARSGTEVSIHERLRAAAASHRIFLAMAKDMRDEISSFIREPIGLARGHGELAAVAIFHQTVPSMVAKCVVSNMLTVRQCAAQLHGFGR